MYSLLNKRIESTQNSLVKHWKKLVTARKERDQTKEFLVEGFHLVEEAIKQSDLVIQLLVREDIDIPPHWDAPIIELTAAVAKEISETEQTQGVFAYCRQPQYDEADQSQWKRLLLIDAVQDPGNIGTMIRTADAAGLDAVILGKGCADPFNPKTVRSAQGSHFHIPVVREELAVWVERAKSNDTPIIGTGLQEAVSLKELPAQSSFALLVGNEGSGVDPQLLSQADHVVKIPLYGQAESLNVAVAAGILLYTLRG
ncbi:RNA methyltransferase [Sporosarcina sp. P37]|uniref:TrmH family RNA methyltransferase n=1 Tax=unclassified Sporosarcina TaxID=2647733 RepID=UPI0009C0EC4E|nr:MULTISPECIES: RNA methyltransferase [unclassified Sporosarcina]ARD47131.1 RNA methyltransferase [Sporosarcina sp. P33]ARK23696.1 RNA methyltransferase [Sporosarcina sp. P37]PID17344.1 RNA methyltransferase [Sporosarcina sp. P35]